MRYLLAFAYDGSRFSGFQRGTGERSVEDTILTCIDKHSLGTRLICCSRTDRGVSAIMNTATIDSELSAGRIIGTLNSNIEDIYFYKYSTVPDDFNVRKVQWKKYVYLFPSGTLYSKIKLEDLKKFEGNHDFSNFCKLNGRRTERVVIEVGEEKFQNERAVYFKARGFLWNQIRFFIGYGMERVRNPETPEDPFSPQYRARRLASPELLFLSEIKYENVQFVNYLKKSTARKINREYLSEFSRNYLMTSLSCIFDPVGSFK